MKGKQNRKTFFIFSAVFLLSILFCISGVFAEKLISSSGVKYDSEIFDGNEWNKGFNQGAEWVSVVVQIKDLSNITIDYDKDSVETQLEKEWQIVNFSEKVTDDILEDLERDEFALKKVSYFKDSFSGNITKKGFEKLLKDERLLYIYIYKHGEVDSSLNFKNLFSIWEIILIILIIILVVLFFIYKNKKK